MTQLIRQWVISLMATGLLLGLILAAIPKGIVRKIAGMATGLLLLFAIVNPIVQYLPDAVTDYLLEQSAQTAWFPTDLQQSNETYLEQVMSERCEEYIFLQGQQMGCKLCAVVTCRWEKDLPYPYRAVVYGVLTDGQKKQLTSYINTQLGVSAEEIVYEGDEVEG